MKRVSLTILAILSAAASQAASISYDLGYLISGDTPGATGPWGTLTLTDAAGGLVTATFDFSGGSSGEFVSGFFLNSNKTLSATYLSSSVAGFTGLTSSPTPLGGVSFDYKFGFDISNGKNSNRLTTGESVSFTLSDGLGTLSIADFDKFGTHPGADASKDDIVAGMKIQGLSGGGSSEIGYQQPHITSVVPGPAAAIAFAFGALRRRKRS